MATGRAHIVVGILAIAGGIAWFGLRDSRRANESGSAPANPPISSGASSGAPGGSGKAAISASPGPSLGESGANAFARPSGIPLPTPPDAQAIDAPSHRDVFSAQARDPAWATRTEEELKDRVRKLTLTAVQAVDCRTDQCELTITGPLDAVDATIAKLESSKGLSGLSKSLLLGGPERTGGTGDTLTLRVYALFDR